MVVVSDLSVLITYTNNGSKVLTWVVALHHSPLGKPHLVVADNRVVPHCVGLLTVLGVQHHPSRVSAAREKYCCNVA